MLCFLGKGENQRKSAKICVWARFVPLGLPLKRAQKSGSQWKSRCNRAGAQQTANICQHTKAVKRQLLSTTAEGWRAYQATEKEALEGASRERYGLQLIFTNGHQRWQCCFFFLNTWLSSLSGLWLALFSIWRGVDFQSASVSRCPFLPTLLALWITTWASLPFWGGASNIFKWEVFGQQRRHIRKNHIKFLNIPWTAVFQGDLAGVSWGFFLKFMCPLSSWNFSDMSFSQHDVNQFWTVWPWSSTEVIHTSKDQGSRENTQTSRQVHSKVHVFPNFLRKKFLIVSRALLEWPCWMSQ